MEGSNGNDQDDLANSNPWSDDFKATTSSSHEMTAALEHAQATAANLTNWAGRAFRRAVAQHAQENGLVVPEAAKPKVLNADHANDTGSKVQRLTTPTFEAKKSPPKSLLVSK